MDNNNEKSQRGTREMRIFARNMRYYRERKKLTQKEIADSSEIDLATVNQMENVGLSVTRDPRLSSLVSVANALSIPLLEMFRDRAYLHEEVPPYLTFSEWFWVKLIECIEILNRGRVIHDEATLRHAFEGFLAVVRPDREFTQQEKELIWNDRPQNLG